MRVIICDDEPLAREYLTSIIQQAGYDIIAQVANGAEAVNAVKTLQADVILLDIHMPEMDGVRCAALNCSMRWSFRQRLFL